MGLGGGRYIFSTSLFPFSLAGILSHEKGLKKKLVCLEGLFFMEFIWLMG